MTQKLGKQQYGRSITHFKGYYQFLSIDYKANVYYEGFLYPSVATAFHAARTNDINLRRRISEVQDLEEMKKIITEMQVAPDWANRRLNVMALLNRDKFKRSKDLGLKLFATQSRQLINGYQKGGDAEMFWGAIERNGHYQGLNTLGKILSNLRQEMKLGLDNKNWVNGLNLQKNEDQWPEANLIAEKQGGQVDNLLLVKKNSFFIGSHELNDFRISDASISKFHASIYFSSDMQVILIDLNSSQGTIIERKGVEQKLEPLRPQSLQDRDVIKFGTSAHRHTIYFSYDQVEKRIKQKQRKAKQQFQRAQKLKKLEQQALENEAKQKTVIKSLLQVKDYACLYVQNINRNFTYGDIRQTFSKYGQVKNIRINTDAKTKRFMGSVLVFYDEKVKVRNVLENISKEPIKFQFRVVAVSAEEAEKIIASFTTKQMELQKQRRLQQLKQRQANHAATTHKRETVRESRSRSRSRRKSSSQSSSSSSGSSDSAWSKNKRVSKYDK